MTLIRWIAAPVLFATPASADAVDDYVACLIGHAAVALHKQAEPKDGDKALEVAYGVCQEPKDLDETKPKGSATS